MKFKKKELTIESLRVILHDLECLKIDFKNKDNIYHYNLLKSNLKDIWGLKLKK